MLYFQLTKALKKPKTWSKWIIKMLTNIPKTQLNLFHSPLSQILNINDPLIALADAIDWQIFEDNFAKFYSKEGRPAKPIRLMVGILLLTDLTHYNEQSSL